MAAALTALLSACGSGGGGGISNPADARIGVSPGRIDSGDRVSVEARVLGITEDRILVKIRYPNQLSYVRGSYVLSSGLLSDSDGPDIRASDTSNTYLVDDIDLAELGIEDDEPIYINFELLGTDDLPSGMVELDVDINGRRDEGINFDITDPRFDAQSDSSVGIGPAPSPTPEEEE